MGTLSVKFTQIAQALSPDHQKALQQEREELANRSLPESWVQKTLNVGGHDSLYTLSKAENPQFTLLKVLGLHSGQAFFDKQVEDYNQAGADVAMLRLPENVEPGDNIATAVMRLGQKTLSDVHPDMEDLLENEDNPLILHGHSTGGLLLLHSVLREISRKTKSPDDAPISKASAIILESPFVRMSTIPHIPETLDKLLCRYLNYYGQKNADLKTNETTLGKLHTVFNIVTGKMSTVYSSDQEPYCAEVLHLNEYGQAVMRKAERIAEQIKANPDAYNIPNIAIKIIASRDDPFARYEDTVKIAELLHEIGFKVSIESLPGAAHTSSLEVPGVAKRMLGWIKGFAAEARRDHASPVQPVPRAATRTAGFEISETLDLPDNMPPPVTQAVYGDNTMHI